MDSLKVNDISSQPLHACSNPFDTVVYYFLIEGMIGLSHWNEFQIVSALMCMVTYYTRPMVSHDLRLLGSHDFTFLLHV